MLPSADNFFSDINLAGRRAVTMAVSGGSDSLGLLVLLKSWLDRHAPSIHLRAITVDHGLRTESAGEARGVAALCRSLGVDHRIVTWEGPKPVSGLAAAAREARYDLLAQAAVEAGADIVMTGHTMDDQAETVRMRERRDRSGEGRGLAAMASATLFDDRVWIVRPLLGVRRRELRALLNEKNIEWIDDPSNENAAYERVRIRGGSAGLPDSDVVDITHRAAAAGRRREALSDAAAELIEHFAARPAPGLFQLDCAFLQPGTDEAALHALRILLAVAGGRPHLPDKMRAHALMARLASGPLRATLSRAVVDRRRTAIWLYREGRGMPDPMLIGEPFFWDGRWRISASGLDRSLHIAAFGPAAVHKDDPEIADAPRSLLRKALSREPALWRGDDLVGLACSAQARGAGLAATRVAAPFARFLSGFDLAAAAAIRRMLALPDLPALPLRKHIAV